MAIEMPFHKWKKKFAPLVYRDLGSYCDEHDAGNGDGGPGQCGCEYLITWYLEELVPGGDAAEEYGNALKERRVWTLQEDGTITSGVDLSAPPGRSGNYLITEKPWQAEMEII